MLCGGATLCEIAASAGEPLIDFRAIGKTRLRLASRDGLRPGVAQAAQDGVAPEFGEFLPAAGRER